ncbi:MAG: alpha/beta hydrolase [Rhodococcus sp. (in: high G+C Gram-positive bacteria)]
MKLSSVGSRLVVLAAVAVVAASCGVGPSTRPDVAVEGGSAGSPADSSDTDDAEPEPLPLEAPITDLNWSDCTARATAALGVVATPGVVVDCATFAAPIDREVSSDGRFELSAVRVSTTSTPPDAVPLVYTSGLDRPSSADVVALAAQPDTSFLTTHPVVGVDRRGIGNSAPFDCYNGARSTRDALADLGQFSPGDDPTERVATLARDATIACTDFLLPEALIFAVTNSADDLEALREAWGVRALSLLGSGNGALIALAYTSAYGDHVARLVLDSPTSVITDAVSTAEQTVKGEEAALTAFATRCAAIGCSLGADPRAGVVELFRRADAGELAPLSGAIVRQALVHLLSYPAPAESGARIEVVADTVSAALAGDTTALDRTVNIVRTLTETDGHFVSRCTDGQQWPAPDRVRELQTSWSNQYPAFGSTAALDLLTCSAWPATTPPPIPSAVDVPVLVLSGNNDAVVGNDALPAVTGALAAAGAATTTVTWDGVGHPVTVGSGCGRQAVATYLESGTVPSGGNACPA